MIREIRRETADTKTYLLCLENPSDGGIPPFKPGQFNMVSVLGIGEAPISFSSPSDLDGVFAHTVRAVGNVTKALARMRRGDQGWVRGPFGRGWPLEAATKTQIMIVAGGLGLAPLRPVVLNPIRQSAEHRLTLLYGAREPGQLLYRREIEDWRRRGVTVRLTVDEVPDGSKWDHKVGVVTRLLDEFPSASDTAVFVCGPEPMMRFTLLRLLELGWDINRIWVSLERRMECGIATCGRCQVDSVYVCKDGPVFEAGRVTRIIGVYI